MGVLVHWKTLGSKPEKPRVLTRDRYATRAELVEEVGKTGVQVKELQEYTHESVHALREIAHATQLKMETMRAQIPEQVKFALSPIENKLEATNNAMIRVLTYMESLRKGDVTFEAPRKQES